jgi:hypothetical protein
MLKLLLGPALLGTGYLAGSIYGRDAEQLVHKIPSATYGAVEAALDNIKPSGTTFFDGGTPMPYAIKVDRTADQQLLVTLSFNGQQGATAELDFAPANGGKDTLVTVHMHGDRSVLSTALAGTSKARLAYAPDWMLNLAARPLLQQVAGQIEQGELTAFDGMNQPDPEAQWESSLSSEQREQASEYQQYEATRPAVDPDADAQNHVSGSDRGQPN